MAATRIKPPQHPKENHFPINTHQSLRATRCGGRQKEGIAVAGWRQLEQRCELRARLCELEQRLDELERELLGSNYFKKKKYPLGHVYCVIGTCLTLPSLGGWCISIASDKPEHHEHLRRQRPASCPLC